MIVYFAIVTFVGMLAVAAWRPLTAVALVVVTAPSYLLRTEIFGFPTTVLEMAMLGTFAGYAAYNLNQMFRGQPVVRRHWKHFNVVLSRPLMFWACLVVLGWSIATGASAELKTSLGAMKSWLLEPMILGLMMISEFPSSSQRRLVDRAVLVALLWVSLAGLIQVGIVRESLENGRLSSVFAPVANYFAMFAAPLMVYAFGLAELGRERKLALGALSVGVIALLLSLSYGGILSFAAGVIALVITLFPKPRRQRSLVAIAVAGMIFFVVMLPTPQFREKINFSTRSSSLVRTEIWRTAVEIGRQHPITGIGPGTFERAYREVAPVILGHAPLEWLVAKPHNLYLNLWVETGILGLVSTLACLGIIVRKTLRGRQLSSLAGAVVITILVHGLVDTPLFKNDLSVLAVVMVVMGLIAAGDQLKSNTTKN